MSDVRLWYPQIDIFDTIRRYLVLLSEFENPPSEERLSIADFYLANTPLLHSTTMKSDERKQFRELNIPRPDKVFVTFPAAPLLFHRMQSVQKLALQTLVAKGLLSYAMLREGKAQLTDQGKVFPLEFSMSQTSGNEKLIANFIANRFASEKLVSIMDLRRKTSLRRVAV